MKKIQKYIVVPHLPDKLKPLMDIAHNLWSCWNPEAVELFRSLDPEIWENAYHNPVKLLGMLSNDDLSRLLRDEVFLDKMDGVAEDLKRYMEYQTWYERAHGDELESRIAYFSAEFGIHECLPIYSGGLGILAGDHFKSTSELGLPMVGVGLAYRFGYYQQYLNLDGWQQETYPENDFYNMPMVLEKGDNGKPVEVDIPFPGRTVYAYIWRVQVGRIPLFLLDTNLEKNSIDDRNITSNLYGGDNEMRIKQEIVLGIGGIRALEVLGQTPTVTHMNEGHAAFLALERTSRLMKENNLTIEEARGLVAGTNVFTTHTPVPAGIDRFDPELVKKYLGDYCKTLKISIEALLDLGMEKSDGGGKGFSMAVLACRFACHINGVSKLHGEVSREMWHILWPDIPLSEVPIGHITNGIHTLTWLSDEMRRLYNRYMGTRWVEEPENHAIWGRIDDIPDAEIWGSHQRLKERLIGHARKKLKEQLKNRGAHSSRILEASDALDPSALTIGFARRFATYKRSTLLMKDLERFARILSIPGQPVQFIFAGKAHPADTPGKKLIQEIVHLSQQEPFKNKVVFLENYDINLARYMVQGVDVWLNTPRRPMEASGTSGMKVVANGGLTLSILDGWWPEGYDGENGWAIGSGEDYEDEEYQDSVESQALYELLEKEVIPLYYMRGKDGTPREWIEVMKNSIRTLCPVFNTNRMVEDYTEKEYLPAIIQWNWVTANNMEVARSLAKWKVSIAKLWDGISIRDVKISSLSELLAGDKLPIEVHVDLVKAKPDDITVEVFHGRLDPAGEIVEGKVTTLEHSKVNKSGCHIYAGSIPCVSSGQFGFAVRVLPSNPALTQRFETGLIHWWK